MKIKLRDSKKYIAEIIDSMLANPLIWNDWSALYIQNIDFIEITSSDEKLITAETILESYLDNLDGMALLAGNDGIFIMGKNIPETDLLKIGYHINDFIIDFKTTEPVIQVFNLYFDHDKFVHLILKNIDTLSHLESYLNTTDKKQSSIFIKSELFTDDSIKLDQGINKKKRALIIEDDAITRWMIRKTLQNDCTISMASSVNKAFSVYQTYRPDIVFLDINLPDGSGFDVLQWIIRHDPGAYVVMFSGNDNILNISKANELGAKGFICKPFIKDNLLEYLYRCTGR